MIIDPKVDIKLAIDTFEQILAEDDNANRVVRTCRIYTADSTPEGVTKHPSCAVGHVYHRLVPEDAWEQNDAQAWPYIGWEVDSEAEAYLLRLQEVQDSLVPWGAAHEIALDSDLYYLWFEAEGDDASAEIEAEAQKAWMKRHESSTTD